MFISNIVKCLNEQSLFTLCLRIVLIRQLIDCMCHIRFTMPRLNEFEIIFWKIKISIGFHEKNKKSEPKK